MIGMVAFIVDVPKNITDPATVMPVQVYLWAESLEQGFVEKTAAAILTLLIFLIFVNLIAVFVRKRYQISY
jgi:phosphate transport system permease protein